MHPKPRTKVTPHERLCRINCARHHQERAPTPWGVPWVLWMMSGMSNSSSPSGSSNRGTSYCASKISDSLVRQILNEICSTLTADGTIKLSSFGLLAARNKAKRVGRNPKTGEVVPVEARKSITFSPSPILKARVKGSQQKPRSG